jgi:hypothetical protein
MSRPLNIYAAINLAAAEAGKPRRFKILAYSGGTLNVDGFPLPVIVDLSGIEVPGNIPILIDHKKSVDATLGLTDTVANDGRTLMLAGVVTGQSATALQVVRQSDGGHQWQASIGAMVTDSEEITAGQSVEVNGQTFVGPVIVARRSVLRETSVLPMGADPTTSVNLAATAAATKGSPMSFDEWLKSLGLDPAALDEKNRAVFQTAYDGMQAPAQPAAPAMASQPGVVAPSPAPTAAAGAVINLQAMIADANKQIAATLRRNAEIQAKAAGHPQIAAKAIEEGWSVDKVELEVLKASQRTNVSATSFRTAEANLPQAEVIEAAACMTLKLKDHEKQFKPEILQAAHSQYRRGIGLQQMIMLSAAANGYHAGPGERITLGNIREVLAYACPDARTRHLQAAGFSTVNLPGILSNVANKEILEGYMEEDAAWQEISQRKSVSDFKAVTSYRMLDDMTYEELGPGASIKHGSIGEESYTRQAKTYAKMFVLERTQIINDDMGAFDDLRERVGRGAAKRLTEVFWTAFVNNSSFFTTARTNYIEGATTNLGTDGVGLGLGVTAFRKMTSPSADSSKRVGAGKRPEILLVPPELEHIATTLYTANNLTAVKASDANIFVNKYRPVVAWQLSNSAYTGNSTTAWYLLAAPNTGATIVVSFLNGQETPTVESADADFNQLGIQFRGYHDFGVDMAEYLGGLKSKGAA